MIGKTISHYKILEQLGQGGMGVVYKAEDLKLERLVAIKLLPEHVTEDSEEKARLLQEARAAAALTHPNITIIHETNETEGQAFIAMEYLEGKPSSRRLRPGLSVSMRSWKLLFKRARGWKKPTPTASCIGISSRVTSWSPARDA